MDIDVAPLQSADFPQPQPRGQAQKDAELVRIHVPVYLTEQSDLLRLNQYLYRLYGHMSFRVLRLLQICLIVRITIIHDFVSYTVYALYETVGAIPVFRDACFQQLRNLIP